MHDSGGGRSSPILLLEPPHRLFTAWTGVSPDRRPSWLALGLFLAFAVVLIVPHSTTPDGPPTSTSRVRPGGFGAPAGPGQARSYPVPTRTTTALHP